MAQPLCKGSVQPTTCSHLKWQCLGAVVEGESQGPARDDPRWDTCTAQQWGSTMSHMCAAGQGGPARPSQRMDD